MGNFKFIVGAACALLLTGCASHSVVKAPDLAHDVRAQQEQVESRGVYLTARPIHQKEQLEAYFDEDLIKLGILPVQVNVINKEGDRNYYLRPHSVALYDAEGNQRMQLGLEKVIERTKKSYWRTAGWGVAFGLIGAGVSAANVAHINKKMRQTYSEVIFKGGNLNQGNITHGFIFFDVPKELADLDGWSLDMLLADPKDGDSIAFQYRLSGTVLARKSAETASDAEEE